MVFGCSFRELNFFYCIWLICNVANLRVTGFVQSSGRHHFVRLVVSASP
jgi:hypothetical protein